MENPKAVGRLFLGVAGLAIVLALIDSILVRDSSWFLWTLAVIAVLFAVCVVVSLFFTVTFAPVLWLLSRASGKGRDPKQSDEKRDAEG